MAVLKNYIVVSPVPIVIEEDGTALSYNPGDVFQALDNNPSVVRNVTLGKLVETTAEPMTGPVVVSAGGPGPTGPVGPTGPAGGFPTLGQTLVVGSATIGTDITISNGDAVVGESALNLIATGLNPLRLTAQGTLYDLSATGAGLTTTAQDIIGAINEIDSLVSAAGSLATVLTTGNVTGGTDLVVSTGDSIVGSTNLDLAATGLNPVRFTSHGTLFSLSASGAALTTTAQDIIGAINELDADIAGSNELSEILANGNTTGANDIVITGGQQINGGRANFGTTTDAAADGDFAAGLTGGNRIFFDQSTGILNMTGAAGTGFASYQVDVDVNNQLNAMILKNSSALSNAEVSVRLRNDADLGLAFLASNAANWAANFQGHLIRALDDTIPLTIQHEGVNGAIAIVTQSAGAISLSTNNTTRWTIDTSGHLTTGTDNTYDIGVSGATRPRTGYFGRSLFVGTPAAEPTDEGSFAAGGNFDGVLRNDLNNASVGANAVASVKAASNVGGIQIRSLGSNHATLPAGAELLADSGITGGLVIRTTGTVECDILFSAGAGFGNHDWAIKSSLTPGARGHLVTGTDNTYDIGASGATRPRTIYAGTSVAVGAALTLNTTTLSGSSSSFDTSAALDTTATEMVAAVNEVLDQIPLLSQVFS